MLNRTPFPMSKFHPVLAGEGALIRWGISLIVGLGLVITLESMARLRLPIPKQTSPLQMDWVRLQPSLATPSTPSSPKPTTGAQTAKDSLARASAANIPAAKIPAPSIPRPSRPPTLNEVSTAVPQAAPTPSAPLPAESTPVKSAQRIPHPPAPAAPATPPAAVQAAVRTIPKPPEPFRTPPAPAPEPTSKPGDASRPTRSTRPQRLPTGSAPSPVREKRPGQDPTPAIQMVSPLDLDSGFRLLTRITPHYPERARRFKRSGQVQLEVLVGTDGRVTRVNVVGESGGWGFGRAAQDAFRDAEFTPPTASGRPVRVRWRKTILFRP